MIQLYLIRNKVNGKVYVGKTRRTLAQRWYAHIKLAKTGASFVLSRSIRKYGSNNFSICQQAVAISEQEANQLERSLIQLYQANNPDHGYNMTNGGDGFSDPPKELIKRRADSLRKAWKRPEIRAKGIFWGHGQKSPKHCHPEIKTETIVELYQAGNSIRKVSQLVGINVARRLREAGIVLRSKSEAAQIAGQSEALCEQRRVAGLRNGRKAAEARWGKKA